MHLKDSLNFLELIEKLKRPWPIRQGPLCGQHGTGAPPSPWPGPGMELREEMAATHLHVTTGITCPNSHLSHFPSMQWAFSRAISSQIAGGRTAGGCPARFRRKWVLGNLSLLVTTSKTVQEGVKHPRWGCAGSGKGEQLLWGRPFSSWSHPASLKMAL